MTCKEFERKIPDFIGGKLDFLTLRQFGEHMEQCPECREELEIQFLVTEGMQRLEEGDSFDLQGELSSRLEEARGRVKFHSAFLYIGAVLELLVIAALIGVIVWVLV